MVLAKHERLNPLWLKLKDHLEAELVRLRELNDKMVSEVSTAETRGRIAQVKDLLKLDNEEPPPLEVVTNYVA